MTDEARQDHAPIICHHCRDVIGVYEPLVVETPTGRCVSSLAADSGPYERNHPCYHRACYELIHDDA